MGVARLLNPTRVAWPINPLASPSPTPHLSTLTTTAVGEGWEDFAVLMALQFGNATSEWHRMQCRGVKHAFVACVGLAHPRSLPSLAVSLTHSRRAPVPPSPFLNRSRLH